MPKKAAAAKNPCEQSLLLDLKSTPASTDRAEARVVAFARKAGYGESQLHEIALAVREAVANAVLHGNCCDLKKKVHVTAAVQPKGLLIRVRDEGKGFDPDSVPDPLSEDKILQASGRGVFLVRSCMDDVAVRKCGSRGTEVKMFKRSASDQNGKARQRTSGHTPQ